MTVIDNELFVEADARYYARELRIYLLRSLNRSDEVKDLEPVVLSNGLIPQLLDSLDEMTRWFSDQSLESIYAQLRSLEPRGQVDIWEAFDTLEPQSRAEYLGILEKWGLSDRGGDKNDGNFDRWRATTWAQARRP